MICLVVILGGSGGGIAGFVLGARVWRKRRHTDRIACKFGLCRVLFDERRASCSVPKNTHYEERLRLAAVL